MEIADIKQNLSIVQVLEHYGIKPDNNNQIRCPFHDDDKPSCKIYLDTNTYHCFACGKTGDVIQFIQDKENCTKHEALKKAKSLITGQSIIAATPKQIISKPMKENFTELFSRFLISIEKSENAKKYCNERGLDYKALQIGYNSGINWKKLKQCITFPLKDKVGNITSLYGRRIINSTPGFKESHSIEFGKHYYSENRKGLYPNYPKENTETLIITEAILDAASLLQVEELQSIAILSAYGTNGLTTEHNQAINQLPNLQEVIFFFDGDAAGKDGVIKNTEKLQHLKCKITSVPTPDGEDVNSMFVTYGKEAILQLIEERQVVNNESFLSIEKSSIEEKGSDPSKALQMARAQSPLNTEQPNKITYTTQTARYIVKGSLPKTFDRMTISLDVQHLETAIKYRTRLDLYEEKQVRKEAREAAEKLELRSDLIENDLSQLTDLLEEYRENQLQQSTKDADSDKTLTLAQQAKFKAFLQQPGLIQKLNQLIGQSGITGEENNRLFLFVIATSHKMPDTLHALIQGSSGSGKTHLLSKIAELMPTERVVKFTRVTENSFYNYDEYFFRGKLICLEDIDGLKEEALFAWRELISNNQLSSSTSQKDENGNIRSAQRIVRGPMASICATTHGQIYEDNMSRLFIIAVDESQEQTARIMNYQKQKAAGLIDAEKEREASALLQNLVRMLKPCKVINPFAYQIHLPGHCAASVTGQGSQPVQA